MEKDYEIVNIDSIEEIGYFDDEYVYDLEMEDESHTFIGNDILVHNTDSIFVGFDHAIKSCEWKNRVFNDHWLNKCPYPYLIISENSINIEVNNDNLKGIIKYDHTTKEFKLGEKVITELPEGIKVITIDGSLVKNQDIDNLIEKFKGRVLYNWAHEIEFIHGMDKFRIEQYFKDKLNEHAASYGVENVQDFELEKISESIINLEKKKYIQHITWEEGISYDRLTYFQPKGVELVRSSTPQFARDKDMGIYRIIKYLFNDPESFNISELIQIVKDMKQEFELADINNISGQSSCSNYTEKVLDDKNTLDFVVGTHFAVKAAAYHNYLLHQNKSLQTKYEYLKSGDKIKYYYTKSNVNPIFAFKRGEFPVEFAPEVDYDTQFEKVILAPVNSIIKKLDMPEINKRLTFINDIFSGL
jgi:hypothetical protein